MRDLRQAIAEGSYDVPAELVAEAVLAWLAPPGRLTPTAPEQELGEIDAP